MYCYKRKIRKREEQAEFGEYPDESDTDDTELDHNPTGKETEAEKHQPQISPA